MSLESSIENLLREAISRGEFDDLKGKGKPLDLTPYFSLPEDLRLAYSLLKSNEFVPDEVQLLNEIGELKRRIAETDDPTELIKKLNECKLKLDLALEKYRKKI